MCVVAFKACSTYVVSGLILFSPYIRRTVGVGERRVNFRIKNNIYDKIQKTWPKKTLN